jgi:hyperosmotically inducible protein
MTSYKLRHLHASTGAMALGTLVLLAGLGACGKQDETATVGQQLDSAIAKTEQSAAEAKVKAQASLDKATDAIKSASQAVEVSGQKTADGMVSLIDDVAITAAVSAELSRDAELSALRINVNTKGGNVTLIGPAPTTVAKEKATAIAKSVKGVVAVDNKLMVKAV